MKQTRPRDRMVARLSAVKRRRKGVEFTAGLSPDSNGFFLFRKRNPFEFNQHEEDSPAASTVSTDSPHPESADEN